MGNHMIKSIHRSGTVFKPGKIIHPDYLPGFQILMKIIKLKLINYGRLAAQVGLVRFTFRFNNKTNWWCKGRCGRNVLSSDPGFASQNNFWHFCVRESSYGN
jgi:hypothetical protein